MTRLRIYAARHSAFYSPLLAAFCAGFLEQEGLEASYAVLPAGAQSRDLIRRGEAHIVQSAVSSSWRPLEAGETDLPLHFAQINCRDGFFLTARQPPASFRWKDLEGATLLADHGGQPLVMLRYALRCQAVDCARVRVVNAGNPEEMDARFRAGEGDYIHQQGPAAQQLQHDGIGYTVASVGEAMPEVAFSSLAASREFLVTEEARRFARAYRRARQWVRETPPRDVARAETALFPETAPEALEAAVAQYQKLGCWYGDMNIAPDLYEQAWRVFLSQGAVRREHPYEAVVVDPPAAF